MTTWRRCLRDLGDPDLSDVDTRCGNGFEHIRVRHLRSSTDVMESEHIEILRLENASRGGIRRELSTAFWMSDWSGRVAGHLTCQCTQLRAGLCLRLQLSIALAEYPIKFAGPQVLMSAEYWQAGNSHYLFTEYAADNSSPPVSQCQHRPEPTSP